MGLHLGQKFRFFPPRRKIIWKRLVSLQKLQQFTEQEQMLGIYLRRWFGGFSGEAY